VVYIYTGAIITFIIRGKEEKREKKAPKRERER
jgi:hypothetical protein